MKNIALTLVFFILFITLGGYVYSQFAPATPTPDACTSLEDANRRIRELKAENETMQIQHENEQMHRMERQYDSAHPAWYGYPYYVPAPYYGGWGGYHYNHYPMGMHHHHHHHHHHH